MMVSPVIGIVDVSLHVRRPAEFTTPDHQRLVQQPALLQVEHQSRRRLIDVAALLGQLIRKVVMLIPAPVV